MSSERPFATDKIFMKVLDLKYEDLKDWKRPAKQPLCVRHRQIVEEQNFERRSRRMAGPKPTVSTEDAVGLRTQKGYLVSLNDELIALFRVEGKMYAVKDACPHAGGPLSMGDIEELPGEGICVRCPWHQWCIILDSGEIGEHRDRRETAVTYPVKVTEEGDIYIGFDQFSPMFFNLDKHPSVDLPPRRICPHDQGGHALSRMYRVKTI